MISLLNLSSDPEITDLEMVYEKLKDIHNTFGFGALIALVVIDLAVYFLFKFLLKSIEKQAEVASEKAVSKYQGEVHKEIEKQLRLFFRDENIRNELTSHFAKKSIETKLNIWQATYELYFDYQRTWHYSKEKLDKRITIYDDMFQKHRELIFVNSVFLGGFLTSKLITINNMMRHYVRGKYRFFHLAFPDRDGAKAEAEYKKYGTDIENIRIEVEDWINEHLLVDHDIKMWEFTKGEIDIIKDQREVEFETLDKLKGQ